MGIGSNPYFDNTSASNAIFGNQAGWGYDRPFMTYTPTIEEVTAGQAYDTQATSPIVQSVSTTPSIANYQYTYTPTTTTPTTTTPVYNNTPVSTPAFPDNPYADLQNQLNNYIKSLLQPTTNSTTLTTPVQTTVPVMNYASSGFGSYGFPQDTDTTRKTGWNTGTNW